VVGGFGAPSLEALLRVRPTIVIDVGLEDEAVRKTITELGIKYLRVPCSRINDIPAAVKKIGAVLCAEQRANQLADTLSQQIMALRAVTEKAGQAKTAPAVFAEIWSDPLMTAGSSSLIAELITLAGGRNIGDEIAKNYFAVSPEWIIVRDPDIIICFDLADAKTVSARAGWSKIKAVRSGRVYAGLDKNLTERPGPRVLEGIAILRECISGKKMP
jgi:iron complex transport system substrate-binding protein